MIQHELADAARTFVRDLNLTRQQTLALDVLERMRVLLQLRQQQHTLLHGAQAGPQRRVDRRVDVGEQRLQRVGMARVAAIANDGALSNLDQYAMTLGTRVGGDGAKLHDSVL